jgi:hypothetical protein
MLVSETDGVAAAFDYDADPTKRVAVKAADVVTEYAENNFFANAGTSPKQIYDAAGVLGWSPHNMCLRSQEFNQATPWNPTTAVTVTADAIAAPDGTLTADRIVETATSSNHNILHASVTWITGATYALSGHAKAGERNWLSATALNVSPADWFDLTNGVVGTSANGGAMTSAGGGWYRPSITFVKDAVVGGPAFFIRTANGQAAGYSGDITKGLYLWGAQLNRGSTPLPYLPTTTAARYGLALDHNPSTLAARGLLAEPAATNLLLQNATLSTQSVTVTAVAHTLSFWGTGTVTLSGTSTAGPLVGTGANNRVSLTFTPSAGSLTLTVAGTVSRAQLETGTVATSPIPTFAAAATRAADAVNKPTSEVSIFSATAGTVALKATTPGDSVLRVLWTLDDGTASERIRIERNTSNEIHFIVTDGGAAQCDINLGAVANNTDFTVCAAWAASSFAASLNGAAAVTDVAGTLPTLTSFKFGYSSTASQGWNKHLQKMFYLPRRASNAEVASLQSRLAA